MKMRTFYKKLPLFIKNYIDPTYKKLKPQISPFIKTQFSEIIETPVLMAGAKQESEDSSDCDYNGM